MSTPRHYSKIIEGHILPFVLRGDADGLVERLETLSQSAQKTAGLMLGERFLLDCPADVYWRMTETLVHYYSKAYLITLMKTFVLRMGNGTASLSDDTFARLCAGFNELERQKVTLFLLPRLERVGQVEQLFTLMGIAQGRGQMVYLVRIDTLPCLFLLLRSLRYIEHDREEVLKVARQLIKRGTGASFNLASIIKVAFGLDELTGTFSLRLQPYQIARLEQSYEAFCGSVADSI